MTYSRSIFCIALITGIVAFQSLGNATMYRWVDKNGRVFYSDKVPPKESKLERTVFNEKGRVLETVKAAKTKEQIALEKRLRLLRREQEKIIARQKSNDKVLLSTFRNIDDLRMTLNGKMQSVGAQKRVYERTLENLKENLSSVRKKAAYAERNGRKVSTVTLNKMAAIEEKIMAINDSIENTEVKKLLIQKKFAKNIDRFLFLTKGSNISAQELSDETAEITAANTLGLFNCNERKTCDQAWEVARQFVIKHSTTPINFNTDSLIMGRDPLLSNDISLSVSKSTRSNNKVSIFLDIRCHNSTLGAEHCQSKRVKNIRHSFRLYIESAIKN